MKLKGSKSAFAALLLCAAIGCGSKSPQTTTPTSSGSADVAQASGENTAAGAGEADDDSAADLAAHHRYHHHGGFAMFIAMSLDGLNATPEQAEAIEKIQTEMHAKMQPAHDAEKAVLLALADGVAAGSIDQGKLEPLVQQLGAAAGGVHDAVADSINALHQTLTPPQRQALVDKVEAHLAVWHHANANDENDSKEDDQVGHIAWIAKQLSLSAQQVDQIRTAYTGAIGSKPKFDRGEADTHLKAFAAAFVGDQFDAKTLTTGATLNAHMATWGISRTVALYAAATPILTPDQRTKAADELRRHANYKRASEN